MIFLAVVFVALLSNSQSFALAPAASRTIELKQDFKPQFANQQTTARTQAPNTDQTMDLWIPLPMTLEGYQKVVSDTPTGNATKVEFTQVGAVRMLHAQWSKVANPELHLTDVVTLRDHREAAPSFENVEQYLQATQHVQTDGVVRETANKIVAGLSDPDKKAEAIYNWVVEKTIRDPQTRGCGLGDVKTTLTSGNLSGKCADINSVFVGLARAANIPAREVFGIRVDSSKEFTSLGKVGDVSKAQHCRAEYYSQLQKAWIPVDPADVRKAILEEKLALADPKIQVLKHKFFGFWEGNWVALNDGRDFKIPMSEKPLSVNYLMYPRLVSSENSPDGMDPKEVSYVITSKVL